LIKCIALFSISPPTDCTTDRTNNEPCRLCLLPEFK